MKWLFKLINGFKHETLNIPPNPNGSRCFKNIANGISFVDVNHLMYVENIMRKNRENKLIAKEIMKKRKLPHGKCPECGSDDIKVYLFADYNSTIDSINCIGHVSWDYSDAMDMMYCQACDAEFRDAVDVKS